MPVIAIRATSLRKKNEMSLTETVAALLDELNQLSPDGFAVALHIRFTRPTYLFQSYGKPWMDHYSAAGLVIHDPVVRWGLQSVGRLRWSDLAGIDSAGVFEQARSYGLGYGAGLSVEIAGSRSIAACGRSDREFTDGEMAAIENTVGLLHQATLGYSRLSADEQQALTELSIKLTH